MVGADVTEEVVEGITMILEAIVVRLISVIRVITGM